MTLHHLLIASPLLIAAFSQSAWSQANAQPVAPAASGAAATKPGPRVVTTTEQRENSATPGAVRPDPKVTPQVSIPLVNTPVGARKPPFTGRGGNAVSPGGIDDSAARCEAESNVQVRQQCRDKLAGAPKR